MVEYYQKPFKSDLPETVFFPGKNRDPFSSRIGFEFFADRTIDHRIQADIISKEKGHIKEIEFLDVDNTNKTL